MAKLKTLLDPELNHTALLGIQYNVNRGVLFASTRSARPKLKSIATHPDIIRATYCAKLWPTLDYNTKSYWSNRAGGYWRPEWYYLYPRLFTNMEFFISAGVRRMQCGLEPYLGRNVWDYYNPIASLTATGSIGHIDLAWTAPPYATMKIALRIQRLPSAGRRADFQAASLFGNVDAAPRAFAIPDLAPGIYAIWWMGWELTCGIMSHKAGFPTNNSFYWRLLYATVT